jgi:hypothetical protein
MKKQISLLLVSLLFLFSGTVKADEGMWLPYLLKQAQYAQMKQMGLKLTKEDLYSINQSSLKDAVVVFGGGCTGEIISDEGLLLTNMHCGYGQVQAHSTVDNDLLKNGFTAATLEDELPNPGLTVMFLQRVEDVTDEVLQHVTADMTEAEREKAITRQSAIIEEQAVAGSHYDAAVRSFYGGNQFYMMVYETYKDVRLVANPPVAIGDFGSLTDNWMWPRHKADYAIFRVYAGPDGKPAEYSPNNIPLKPKHHLPVSLKGVEENDYAMIMGYPGSTDRYMTSYGIEELIDIDHPNRIKIRGKKLDIINKTMERGPEYRVMYAAKYKGASNYWKYSVAQMAGFKRIDLVSARKAQEEKFTQWVNGNDSRKELYGEALPLMKNAIDKRADYKHTSQYIVESLIRGPEITTFAYAAGPLYEEMDKGLFKRKKKAIEKERERLKKRGDRYFRDYHKPTDYEVAKALTAIFVEDIDEAYYPEALKTGLREYGSVKGYIDYIYDNTLFANQPAFDAFIEAPDKKRLAEDPAVVFARSVYQMYRKIYQQSRQYDADWEKGHRLYVQGLMDMQPNADFYPDANFTMRLTYGKVGGYVAKDAVRYNYYTTLEGVMEKEDPNNYEFIVPDKLKALYKEKNYGRYGYGDEMRVCFITNNDITGGNSGSPVLNGKGELIGLAFDSNWEGMTGDIAFEQNLQRTVCTDIKYLVWLLDEYFGAKRLVQELDIVE